MCTSDSDVTMSLVQTMRDLSVRVQALAENEHYSKNDGEEKPVQIGETGGTSLETEGTSLVAALVDHVEEGNEDAQMIASTGDKDVNENDVALQDESMEKQGEAQSDSDSAATLAFGDINASDIEDDTIFPAMDDDEVFGPKKKRRLFTKTKER